MKKSFQKIHIYYRWFVLIEWIIAYKHRIEVMSVIRDVMRSSFRAKHNKDSMVIKDFL